LGLSELAHVDIVIAAGLKEDRSLHGRRAGRGGENQLSVIPGIRHGEVAAVGRSEERPEVHSIRIHGRDSLDLSAGPGIAVTYFPLKPNYGEADYLLYVDRRAIGVVEAVGKDVRKVKKGDFVVMPFAFSDGTCEFCHEGLQTACVHGGFFGFMARFMSVKNAARVHRIPLAPLLDDLNRAVQAGPDDTKP
jgi:hypothetical protein